MHGEPQKIGQGLALEAGAVLARLQTWGSELGFSQIGVAGVDLSSAEPGLQAWLDAGMHGQMAYMAAHGMKRARPAALVPGTLSIITARMNYLPQQTTADCLARERARMGDAQQAVVSVYARGRDYHKVLRQRLQQLAQRLVGCVGPFGYRVFTDSAPVLEVELAHRSGVGWRGKHTLLLSRDAGSFYFLGEIFTDLPLPASALTTAHCGQCRACLDICPTQAIVAEGVVDARRCISYLTIEHPGAIPLDLRPLIGNHLYGCDDCQLVCPWNKFAQAATLADFDARAPWSRSEDWPSWWRWTEADFQRHTEGSPIRRIGFERWQRNLAVVSGNALRAHPDAVLHGLLQQALPGVTALVAEHMQWALAQCAAAGTH